MEIEVASHVVAQLLAEARNVHPRECCGILLGEGARITHATPAQNVHPAPETHFEIDPQTLIDAHRKARSGGAQVLGYYHSHPVGKAEPSSTDAAMASGDGSLWAIIAGGEIRLWRDVSQEFREVSYGVN